jgi:hypothetical protein
MVTVATPNAAAAIQTRGIQTLRMSIVSGRVIIPSNIRFYWVLPGSAGFYEVRSKF